ncbi:Disks large like protein [Argiope bruennichi]|uniref:Disks large like protein n=1 Tax=Argiope bruennichi TaxID=94029 RepID=A0A8T0ECB7_ARGBR|nr:Disks large like protein [Argiope bruennichi]
MLETLKKLDMQLHYVIRKQVSRVDLHKDGSTSLGIVLKGLGKCGVYRMERIYLKLKKESESYGFVLRKYGFRHPASPGYPIISNIKEGGPADRCGAFCVGDDILAINDIDVSHLTTSKANSLLRNFKKEPGRLVLVANVERLARPKQNSFFVTIGILMKGDRVLAINGQNTNAMTVTEFEHLKEEAFSAEEVSLTVEFDITVRDVQFGTFDVCVTKTSKTGLIYNEKFGDDINLNQAGLSPFKSYDLSKTSIHSNHDSNKMFLEQELILYRDPVAKDFGFLIGQDQSSKTIYVTAIRPDGPADCSKVIRKNDIILQVNGVDLEANKDGPVASLFHPKGDRLELKTRRILNYE